MPPKRKSSALKDDSGKDSIVTVPNGTVLNWQLEDKNGWANYSPEVNDALTAAAMAGHPVVNLQAGRTKMELMLGGLVQKSAAGFEKRVRCCLAGDDDERYAWEVEDKSGEWNPLQAGIAARLNQVMDISSKVKVAGIEYDLVNMTGDGGKQKLRRDKDIGVKFKKTGITGKIVLDPVQPIVKEEEEEEEVPKKKSKSTKKSASKAKVKEEEDEEEEESAPVMKSVKRKGLAAVDGDCPNADKFHVFCEGSLVWDCMLNQTNIQNNNNKYYLIQLLEEDGAKKYAVWMRWGRVGYKGQNSWTVCGGDLGKAKSVFEKKFKDKTINEWSEKDSFAKVAGKYDLVKMDYSAGGSVDEPDSKPVAKVKTEKKKPVVESSLHKAVQELVSLICDIKTMEQSVIEMEYDTKKAPLGKITTDQIRAGYKALKKVSACIDENKTSGKDIIAACNDFYTRIPHEFGFKVPPVIRTHEAVKAKLQLLEALADIQVALKILSDGEDSDLNPVDRRYQQLKVEINHLDEDSEERKAVAKAIQSTHAQTHSQYTMDVEEVFTLDKEEESKNFKDLGNKQLLFHGSRLSNWAGILGQGLRIAPPEAPVTGYMFGKGVYFADMSSKSANYCFTSRSHNTGLLLLCEVSLGKPNKLLNADYNASSLPKGCQSVQGLGRVEPSKLEEVGGAKLAMGPPKNTKVDNKGGYTLQYNEFIVYNTNQIKMKYLARVKFNYKY